VLPSQALHPPCLLHPRRFSQPRGPTCSTRLSCWASSLSCGGLLFPLCHRALCRLLLRQLARVPAEVHLRSPLTTRCALEPSIARLYVGERWGMRWAWEGLRPLFECPELARSLNGDSLPRVRSQRACLHATGLYQHRRHLPPTRLDPPLTLAAGSTRRGNRTATQCVALCLFQMLHATGT
jgi:hypothetical protein